MISDADAVAIGQLLAVGPSAGTWTQLAGALLFVCLGGYFGAVEMALTRLSRVRAQVLANEGARGAKSVLLMIDEPARYLNAILLLTQVSGSAAAILASIWAQNTFGNVGITIATGGVTIVGFVFAEVIPKTYTLQHTERVALLGLPLIRVVSIVVSPISRLLIGIANMILPGRGLKEGPFVSEAEIRHLIEIAGDEESIEDDERQMIHSVFEFNDTIVRAVMVPRPDMIAVPQSASISGALELAIENGYSRIPVYDDDIDHIVGVMYAKDILTRLHNGDRASLVREIARPAQFVPESRRISELLREMQQRKFHLAIVFDEHGSTAGLVTLEDLIEEIVGEIVDEYDTEEPEVVRIDSETLRVKARVPVDEVNDLLDTELPDEEWDTVGGLVVGLLGRMPEPRESVECKNVRFTTEDVEGHRIRTVQIHKLPRDHHEEPAPAEVG